MVISVEEYERLTARRNTQKVRRVDYGKSKVMTNQAPIAKLFSC